MEYKGELYGKVGTQMFPLEETTEEQVLVFVGGVYQQASTYTVNLLDITFTAPPPLGSSISVIHNIGTIV